MALSLSSANLFGYIKCKKDASKKLKSMAGNFLGQQLLSQVKPFLLEWCMRIKFGFSSNYTRNCVQRYDTQNSDYTKKIVSFRRWDPLKKIKSESKDEHATNLTEYKFCIEQIDTVL